MGRLSNEDLRWLLEVLQREGLLEIEISGAEVQVCVRAAATPGPAFAALPQAAAAGACPPALDPEDAECLLSPMAGIFYRTSSPTGAPYVEAGDVVEIGDTVGLIEAMKLYNEVTVHVRGRIIRFMVENEQHVDADQPLALIERFLV